MGKNRESPGETGRVGRSVFISKFNSSQRSTNSDIDSEQHETSQKSICASPHPNCSSLEDGVDIAGVEKNHFAGSFSGSEDDVSDDISFRERLADWCLECFFFM